MYAESVRVQTARNAGVVSREWARSGSNQRTLACEARRPERPPLLGCCSSEFWHFGAEDLHMTMPADCRRLLRLLGTGVRSRYGLAAARRQLLDQAPCCSGRVRGDGDDRYRTLESGRGVAPFTLLLRAKAIA
jgi:hypothetical protein